jgi:glycosyltransferase involved in cell wall biosynthesis
MSPHLVSIIMPCYNSGLFIGDAIRSVLNQTYSNFELIIINDGSTDNSQEIIDSINDSRVKSFYQSNRGQDAALNVGYKFSSGEFIKFLDSDDIINPKMIEIQVRALADNPECVAYGEWFRFFGKDPVEGDITPPLNYWKNYEPLDFLLADDDGPMLQCGIMLLPRKLIELSGPWDERLILYNDTEFFYRLILKSKGIVFTHGAVLFYRSGNGYSLSNQLSRKYFESTYLASNLVAKGLLEKENSERTRRCISNIFFRRLFDLYPSFPDLAKKHKEQIKLYGSPDLRIKGGRLFNFCYNVLGWKAAKQFQRFGYRFKSLLHSNK